MKDLGNIGSYQSYPIDLAYHTHRVIHFDGVCGLCNQFIKFLLKADKRDQFRFTPLQSETALRILGPQEDYSSSLLFFDRGHLYEQSDAVLLAVGYLGGFWKMIKVLRLFPRSLRDYIYRFIAKRRYQLFGKRDACWIPSSEEQNRFLP